ncbi:MAG: hypothetical protein H6600_04415 [Flavobacteriales bacterium]|nr:hypothetical protein [Flavobacteriales bacterium]
MKLQVFYRILIIILISNYCHSQHSNEKLLAIKDSIQLEFNDTLKSKWVKPELNEMLELLNRPDSLFPYSRFDSVVYFQYGTKDKFEPAHWNKIYSEYVIDSKNLSTKKVNDILIVINNPLNFKWGECGTPFIEGAIIFYHSGIEIARIAIACSGGQIYTEPNKALIRWGILNEQGYTALNKIIN